MSHRFAGVSRDCDRYSVFPLKEKAAKMTDPKRHAPATLRNRDPILAVLERVLPQEGLILETNSGSGEHAAYMAPRLAPRTWQPSEFDDSACASIAAHTTDSAADNIRPSVKLDVTWTTWPVDEAAAILSMNMIHIAPWEACLGLLDGAARILTGDDAILYLYGPFKRNGRHTAPSNDAFDRSLRAQDPRWGVRDLDAVASEAEARGLALVETIDMPSNNCSVIFSRTN